MSWLSALLSLSVMLMPASPFLAQQASTTVVLTATTTPTTTPLLTPAGSSSQGGSALGTAALIGLGVGAGIVGFSIASSVLFKSFGGRVVTVIPCVSGLGPSLHVTVAPFGGLPNVFYIWTPATITYSYGPPSHPGQQLLGVSDIPFVCVIPAKAPIPLYGLRMQSVGTSLVL